MTDLGVREPALDPEWSLVVDPPDGDVAAHVQASMLALSDGHVGIRGHAEDGDRTASRYTLVAGCFGRGVDGTVRPLVGPSCTDLVDGGSSFAPRRRRLVMRHGLVTSEPLDGGAGMRTIRFVSLAYPGVVVVQARDGPERGWPRHPLTPPTLDAQYALAAAHTFEHADHGADDLCRASTTSDKATVHAVAQQSVTVTPDGTSLARIAAFGTDPSETEQRLRAAVETGFEGLLEQQRAGWGARWADADIEIEGDLETQLATRFALFHLLGAASVSGESAVGARGLTGLAYAGHVFWDTDVFVLPALAATLPPAARAVLEYRVRRLPAARARADASGLAGAWFPWESADTGEDVTPTSVRDVEGNLVPIRTGSHEVHIDADVAWAAMQYVAWTGDEEFLRGPGRALVLDTAHAWASRIRQDTARRAHLYGVIGPDEYHEIVDDDAYTNGMARWHLETAARLADEDGYTDTAHDWRGLAARLVDNYDPDTGRHEQFAGFNDLEPLLIGKIAKPPVAADLLLGRERVALTQVIKQPDVLMLHHMLPEGRHAHALKADLDYYLPRTAHGSSLSPAICAALLARSGQPDDALRMFELAARLDLDDLTGTTAGGLHLATMGGLWQALVFGFAGIRPGVGSLKVNPLLPKRWRQLTIRLRVRGAAVTVRASHHELELDADRPVVVAVGNAPRATTPARFIRTDADWRQSR